VAVPAGFYGPRFNAELAMRLGRLSERNHFALFGLHWSAYPERIEAAYRREKALFDPTNIPNDLLAHKGKEINELLEAYEAAWETLRWRASRRAHRAVQLDEGALRNAIAHYLEKGEMAAMRGNEEESRDCLLRVMDLDPQDQKATALLQDLGYSHSDE
jgi:hypothetical protein